MVASHWRTRNVFSHMKFFSPLLRTRKHTFGKIWQIFFSQNVGHACWLFTQTFAKLFVYFGRQRVSSYPFALCKREFCVQQCEGKRVRETGISLNEKNFVCEKNISCAPVWGYHNKNAFRFKALFCFFFVFILYYKTVSYIIVIVYTTLQACQHYPERQHKQTAIYALFSFFS